MRRAGFAYLGGVMMSVNVWLETYEWMPVWAVLTTLALIDYAKEDE